MPVTLAGRETGQCVTLQPQPQLPYLRSGKLRGDCRAAASWGHRTCCSRMEAMTLLRAVTYARVLDTTMSSYEDVPEKVRWYLRPCGTGT